jgi:hypothetical protein
MGSGNKEINGVRVDFFNRDRDRTLALTFATQGNLPVAPKLGVRLLDEAVGVGIGHVDAGARDLGQ